MSHKHDDTPGQDILSRQDLAERLEEWARGLRAGRLEVEGMAWSVPENVAICATNPDIVIQVDSGCCQITHDGGKTWFNGHARPAAERWHIGR